MGFLMVNRKLQWIVVSLLFVLYGCPHYRLQIPVIHQIENDWTMYGGNIGRSNATQSFMVPPLDSLWEYDAEAGFGSSTAVATGNFLFVCNLRGEIHAIDIGSGRKEGVYNFGSAIVGTPILDGDMISVPLANENEGLKSYNLKTGMIEWQQPIGNVETSLLLVGNKLLVTTLEGKLFCMEKTKGTIIWIYKIASSKKTKSIHSSPASDGQIVVFGCDNGLLYAVSVETGKLCWSAKTRSSILASPAVRDGRVLIGSTDSTLYAFALSTGNKLWETFLSGSIHSSMAVGRNRIYAVVEREIYCLDAINGSIHWKIKLDGVINSAPLLSGNVVYVGTLCKTIYALDVNIGTVLWQHKMQGRIKTMPLIFKDHLMVFAEDRSVIAFGESHR
jgi:outer membrane protein assembly factor BamB